MHCRRIADFYQYLLALTGQIWTCGDDHFPSIRISSAVCFAENAPNLLQRLAWQIKNPPWQHLVLRVLSARLLKKLPELPASTDGDTVDIIPLVGPDRKWQLQISAKFADLFDMVTVYYYALTTIFLAFKASFCRIICHQLGQADDLPVTKTLGRHRMAFLHNSTSVCCAKLWHRDLLWNDARPTGTSLLDGKVLAIDFFSPDKTWTFTIVEDTPLTMLWSYSKRYISTFTNQQVVVKLVILVSKRLLPLTFVCLRVQSEDSFQLVQVTKKLPPLIC